jgi:hypothetical protein
MFIQEYYVKEIQCPVWRPVEYLYCNPVGRKRRLKGNQVPWDIIIPPCSWWLYIQRPCLPGWGSLESNKQTPWPKSASELYRPSDRRLSAKLVPTFADIGCHVVRVTGPYGRILGFLDRSSYLFFRVGPELYSGGWLDAFPDPLLLRKSGSAGNRTRTSGSVARNSDH